LLERLRIPFEVMTPDIDETARTDESPHETALRLACAKAARIAQLNPDALVIGSDQVASCNGNLIGKPGSHEQAFAQLQQMRGRTVLFHTALCLHDARSHQVQSLIVPTEVKFRDLPDDELNAYLLAEKPYDCAGSAKSEGLGIALLESQESSDPTALVGLPLIALVTLLRNVRFPILVKTS
jgi:septum formation protein